ncbi:MAG: L-aspartate oxidase [Candidatus Latescibacterota bacterium]|jgi:L-aspartate oxidase
MSIEVDYLVIGSGVAGLAFAIKAAEKGSVAVVTKRERHESNTNYAQGGIAAVMDVAVDSFASHVGDTLAAGAGLCREEIVDGVIREGPDVVGELIAWGARFTEEVGALSLAREGGHTYARVVRADDMTGREVARTLVKAAEGRTGIQFLDHHMAVDLLLDAAGRCCGAQVLDVAGGHLLEVRAGMTMLATGGCGQAFLHTTNPEIANGDGVAMAWRAGARVGNMEFMQFHPTMLYNPGCPSFLITEALRGYGAVLVNSEGQSFVDSLTTRDIVSRALVKELQESGQPCVFLDATGEDAEETRRHFPNIYRHCLDMGVDISRERLPVVPAAHYSCGGVCTDEHGQTDVPGLYAAGEVAMTGFQGANRLASNSLLEGLVFARRAFAHAQSLHEPRDIIAPLASIGPVYAADELMKKREALRRLMWDEVGIVRSNESLERACLQVECMQREIEEMYQRHGTHAPLVQLRNLAAVAGLIARSARARLESRGCHFNADHVERDDFHWQRDTLLAANGSL